MKAPEQCPVCDGRECRRLFPLEDLVVGQGDPYACMICDHCGSLYVDPQIESWELSRFYQSGTYYSLQVAHRGWGSRIRTILRRCRRWRGLGTPIRWALLPFHDMMRYSKFSREDEWLDIGCGQGQFLIEMLVFGLRGQGLEPGVHEGQMAHDAGLVIHRGYWPVEVFGRKRFTTVTMNHVLEHSGEPERLLREIHTILDPEGTLVVGVPIVDGLAWSLFGKDWHQLDMPRHHVIFSKMALCGLMRRCGFSIESVRCNSSPTPLVLSCLASFGLHRPSRPVTYLLAALFLPISFLLNRLGRGDQIEVICRPVRLESPPDGDFAEPFPGR